MYVSQQNRYLAAGVTLSLLVIILCIVLWWTYPNTKEWPDYDSVAPTSVPTGAPTTLAPTAPTSSPTIPTSSPTTHSPTTPAPTA